MMDSHNSVSLLNEMSQKKSWNIHYDVTKVAGMSHCPVFRCVILINGAAQGEGQASTKNEAKKVAASSILIKYGVQGPVVDRQVNNQNQNPNPIAAVSDLQRILAKLQPRNVAVVPPETNMAVTARQPNPVPQCTFEDLLKMNKILSVSDLKDPDSNRESPLDYLRVYPRDLDGYGVFLDNRREAFLLSLLDCPLRPSSCTLSNSVDSAQDIPLDSLIQGHKMMSNHLPDSVKLMRKQINTRFSILPEVTTHFEASKLVAKSIIRAETNGFLCCIIVYLDECVVFSQVGFGTSESLAEREAVLNLLSSIIFPYLSADHLIGHLDKPSVA